MNANATNINPYDLTEVKTVVSFAIRRVTVNLFQNASLEVHLFDATGNIVKINFIELTSAEYSSWGADDNYITNLVCTKLGFVVAP